MEQTKRTGVALLGARLGLGAIFLISAAGKLAAWQGTVGYAASKGVPEPLLVAAVALELLGAISLLAGWKTRWGAIALLAFLAPVTVVFHAFWAAPAPELQLQTVQFLKNVSIGGGLLALLAAGPGALSVDARTRAGAHLPVRAAA
jgi:putative oxidoreductase